LLAKTGGKCGMGDGIKLRVELAQKFRLNENAESRSLLTTRSPIMFSDDFFELVSFPVLSARMRMTNSGTLRGSKIKIHTGSRSAFYYFTSSVF
jgi:hypothetical protein